MTSQTIKGNNNQQATGDINNFVIQPAIQTITINQQKQIHTLVNKVANLNRLNDAVFSIVEFWTEVGDVGNAPRQTNDKQESRYKLIPEANFGEVKIFLLDTLNELFEERSKQLLAENVELKASLESTNKKFTSFKAEHQTLIDEFDELREENNQLVTNLKEAETSVTAQNEDKQVILDNVERAINVLKSAHKKEKHKPLLSKELRNVLYKVSKRQVLLTEPVGLTKAITEQSKDKSN